MKTLCLGMGRNMLKVNFDPKGLRNSVKHIQSLAYVRRFTSLHTHAKSCVYFFFLLKKKNSTSSCFIDITIIIPLRRYFCSING